MDEVEAGRADDICRAVVVPAGLMAQLQRHSLAQPRFNVVA